MLSIGGEGDAGHWPYDLDFQSQVSAVSYGHDHTQKSKVQRSDGSKYRVETNGQTDGQTNAMDYFNFPANAVDNIMTSLSPICIQHAALWGNTRQLWR